MKFLKLHSLLIAITSLFILTTALLVNPKPVKADACETWVQECRDGSVWFCNQNGQWQKLNLTCSSKSVTGAVTPPKAIALWQNNLKGGNNPAKIGLINFLSMIIRLLAIIGGILAMVNFIIAGLTFISSAGSSDATSKVKDRLTYSVIGLGLIVFAFTGAGLIGLVFFGDASFILSPKLEGALTPP